VAPKDGIRNEPAASNLSKLQNASLAKVGWNLSKLPISTPEKGGRTSAQVDWARKEQ
jgi:hypothetical protein